jgi:hypothetical protein
LRSTKLFRLVITSSSVSSTIGESALPTVVPKNLSALHDQDSVPIGDAFDCQRLVGRQPYFL